MPTFKLTLAYDGTDFFGWQLQPDRPTVQGALEAALAKILQQPIRVAGSGRTDTGVHALGQVASFEVETELPAASLQRSLNAVLPETVAVVECAVATPGFHAIRDAVRKRYRYVIHDGPVKEVFRRRYCWQVKSRLDVEAMQRGGQGLVGTHDFRSFETNWPTRDSSVRTIYAVDVTRGAGRDADLVQIEVEANGFLYNMVRAIVGTLYEVGRGKRDADWPAEVVAAQNRGAAGMTAPACGLFLLWVDYQAPIP